MITLYKQIETKGLYYKEMWYENADKVLIEHSGKVGYVGTIAKTSMTEKEAAIRLQDFSNVCASEGYTKLSENQLCTIVVQYLLKSKDGNKRDKWLKEEEERAVSAIKSCLKTYRLDLTHAIIAARNWDDEGFRVKYSYKPINDFSVI